MAAGTRAPRWLYCVSTTHEDHSTKLWPPGRRSQQTADGGPQPAYLTSYPFRARTSTPLRFTRTAIVWAPVRGTPVGV